MDEPMEGISERVTEMDGEASTDSQRRLEEAE